MRLHPREEIVRKAEVDLREVVIQWMQRHPELTNLEEAVVFVNVAADPSMPLKYALRVERHGDDQKPAGLE